MGWRAAGARLLTASRHRRLVTLLPEIRIVTTRAAENLLSGLPFSHEGYGEANSIDKFSRGVYPPELNNAVLNTLWERIRQFL